MEIVETSVFTRQVAGLLDSESYRRLQVELADRPDRGAVIPGSGELRKLRWPLEGTGKRGGARVIYYCPPGRELILMLLIYPKAAQEDLTREQLKALHRVAEKELR